MTLLPILDFQSFQFFLRPRALPGLIFIWWGARAPGQKSTPWLRAESSVPPQTRPDGSEGLVCSANLSENTWFSLILLWFCDLDYHVLVFWAVDFSLLQIVHRHVQNLIHCIFKSTSSHHILFLNSIPISSHSRNPNHLKFFPLSFTFLTISYYILILEMISWQIN